LITVDYQIKHVLCAYKDEQVNAEGEFRVDYQKLMRYYNENILEKDTSVSFGNVMSIMRRKGIILPPNPNQHQIVTFCSEAISKFLQTHACRFKIYEKYRLQK
jgi:hypothetical protein